MKKTITYILVFLIFSAACNFSTPTEEPAPPASPTPPALTPGEADSATETPLALTDIPLGAGYGVSGGWFELYFTDPQSPLASQKTGGPDGPLAPAIDSARLSVDVAIYSLSLNSIRDALIRAHKRGVQVRMVMESENLDRSDPQKLKDAGIPILGDRREGLMHDKFVVIDNSEVWLGSMNFTDSGAYTDNNNLMRIRSAKMAENYTKEFEEMFVDDKFGPDVVAETPNPRVTMNGVPIDVFFAPDDNVQASLVDLLDNAKESIYFMAFSFTADPIGDVIRNRARDGVVVAGVMESEQIDSNVGTEFDPFKQAGLDVLRDANEGQMHHKVIIVDENTVVLGSYNFTNSAETRNDENLIVVYNKEIAAQFMAEFIRVHSQAQAAR
jgi:phosphatidylserine/phosphatidylglycerophosphate/cardiolipin synthase-like enzyme